MKFFSKKKLLLFLVFTSLICFSMLYIFIFLFARKEKFPTINFTSRKQAATGTTPINWKLNWTSNSKISKKFGEEYFYDFSKGYFSNKNIFGQQIEKCVSGRSMDDMFQEDWKVCSCCGYCGNKKTFHDFNGRKNVACPRCWNWRKHKLNNNGEVHESLERHRATCTALAIKGILPDLNLKINSNEKTVFRIQYWGSFFVIVKQLEKYFRKKKELLELHVFDHKKPPAFEDNRIIFDDVTRIDHVDDYFDGGIIVHVLEHIENIEKAFVELSRVTKTGGWLIVSVPCVPSMNYKGGDYTKLFQKKGSFYIKEKYRNWKDFKQFLNDRKVHKVVRKHIIDEHFYIYYCPYFKKRIEKIGNFECFEEFEHFIDEVRMHPFLESTDFNTHELFICVQKKKVKNFIKKVLSQFENIN